MALNPVEYKVASAPVEYKVASAYGWMQDTSSTYPTEANPFSGALPVTGVGPTGATGPTNYGGLTGVANVGTDVGTDLAPKVTPGSGLFGSLGGTTYHGFNGQKFAGDSTFTAMA